MDKKPVCVVHICERTEEDETITYIINLYEGEEDKWESYVEKFTLMAERRRQYNHQRINDLIEEKKRQAQLAEKD